MAELEELGEKVRLLLKRFTALQSENKNLRAALSAKEQEINTLQQQLAQIQQDALAGNIARALPDKKERTAARRQIDTVIKEIDKILINLND